MVLKRSLENSGSENTKKQKLDSKELLVNDKNRPELVIDLTEEAEYIETEKRLYDMVNACINGQIEVVEQLLKLGFDVNSRDSSNNTVLHYAAANGHERIVEKLLQTGVFHHLLIFNESQFTPLHLASLNGHAKVIKELLKHKVDADFYNAFEFAARNGYLSAVKELLKSGEKAYIGNVKSALFPVLNKLSSKLSENQVKILAEILNCHPLPIHQAIEQLQSPEAYLVIRQLFKRGISPDLQNEDGETVLHKAILEQVNSQTFDELLKNGVNMEIKDNYDESPLHLAFYHRNYEFVKLLLKYGANPNHQVNDEYGYGGTLLHEASLYENLSVAKILLEHGADVNALDNHKQTPLHRVIIDPKSKVIRELLRSGANVNLKDSDGDTPLHKAAFDKTMPEDLFQDMLKQSNDLNVNDSEGKTPLHIASENGCESSVKNLLQYGADANVRDFDTDKSLEKSMKSKQIGTFKVLIYHN